MYNALSSQASTMETEFSRRVVELLSEFGTVSKLYPVSAKDNFGIENIIAMLQRLMLAGDDYEIGK